MQIIFFVFKQKTAYEMRISDWSSDVCSSDLRRVIVRQRGFSTRIAVILSEKRNAVSLVDAGFRLPERHGADISGIEDGPGFQTFLTKKDRERIKLLPCAASRNPYFQ